MPLIKADALAAGNLVGAEHGVSISLILDRSEPGRGPRLHRHPYDETWVVEQGRLTFRLGGEELTAGPGDVVIAPADTPHAFINSGSEPARLVCIHASPTMITEWLE